MNRPDLVRHLKGLADDGQIQLREKEVVTSEGGLTLAHARIAHHNAAVDGYGTAPTRDAAIDKALWETEERRIFRFSRFSPEDFKPFHPIRRMLGAFGGAEELRDLHNLGRHSVGCAVHGSKARAARAAVQELIERHTVLVAQLMAQPGFEVHCAPIRWNNMNLAITHYCWQGPLLTYCVLTEIRKEGDDRILFSTGAGDSVDAACAKALMEALGHAENFEFDASEPADLSSGKISELKRWHMQNFDRKAFYRASAPLTGPPRIDAALDRRQFWTATTTIGKGLHFARAYSHDTQNLFVGCWEPSRIHSRFAHLWKEGMEPPYAY